MFLHLADSFFRGSLIESLCPHPTAAPKCASEVVSAASQSFLTTFFLPSLQRPVAAPEPTESNHLYIFTTSNFDNEAPHKRQQGTLSSIPSAKFPLGLFHHMYWAVSG